MPRPSHPHRLDHSNYTCRRVQITKLLIMKFSPLPVTSSPLTPSLYVPPSMSETKFSTLTTHRTIDKITALYILIFTFFRHRNYSTQKVSSAFISRCLTAASNGERSLSSRFPNSPWPQPPVSQFSQLQLSTDSMSKLYYDRRSVGQSVLVSGSHLGPVINLPLLSLIIFWQLRDCLRGAPSLTRGRVCSSQLLLGITSAVILGSGSRGTHGHIQKSNSRYGRR
jgi:hypothetical protein